MCTTPFPCCILPAHRTLYKKSNFLLKRLLDDPKYSDLTVLVGPSSKPETFKLHRAVLGERSVYFDRVCRSGFIESQTQEIKLEEVDPVIFKLVVRFLYTGEFAFHDRRSTAQDLAAVYELADYFDIITLKDIIVAAVWKKLGNYSVDIDFTFVVHVLDMLLKTSYDTEKLGLLVKKVLERKKLGVLMQRESFKELLDRHGVLGRLILENPPLEYQMELKKGWTREARPKVLCDTCNRVRDLSSYKDPIVLSLTCGHTVGV